MLSYNKFLKCFDFTNSYTNILRGLRQSTYNMDAAIEDLEKNPFFNKYSHKIAQAQKASQEEFFAKLVAMKDVKENSKEFGFSQVSGSGKTSLPKGAYAFAPRKKLDSIMKTELLLDKSPEEIAYIWNEHFRHKDCICGVLSPNLYNKICDNSVKYPVFIFPLPRNTGYEFIVCQFAAHEVHFTSLINYQAFKENAPECLVMIHYTDFESTKDIILVHGEFDKNVLSSQEAQFLANQVQMYYSGSDPVKLELLQTLHKSPESFKHSSLINLIEEMDLTVNK